MNNKKNKTIYHSCFYFYKLRIHQKKKKLIKIVICEGLEAFHWVFFIYIALIFEPYEWNTYSKLKVKIKLFFKNRIEVGRPELQLMRWEIKLQMKDKNSRGPSQGEGGTFLRVLPPGSHQFLTVNIRKITSCWRQREGKWNILKYARAFYSG